jgi:hypothetical protein
MAEKSENGFGTAFGDAEEGGKSRRFWILDVVLDGKRGRFRGAGRAGRGWSLNDDWRCLFLDF